MNTPRRSMRIVRAAVALAMALATSSYCAAQYPLAETLPLPSAEFQPPPGSQPFPLSPPENAPTEMSPPANVSPQEYWIEPATPGAPPVGDLQNQPLELQGLAAPTVPLAPQGTPAPPPFVELFGYDTTRGQTSWIIGHNDRFGILSFESLPTLKPGENRGVVGGFGLHFLDGPVVTDMPARLFDFSIGYQARRWITPKFGVDLVGRVGAFSDFEGSARDGVRFPSHAVSFMRLNPSWELLFGVDYLDRDDISLLPVFGPVWAPNENVRIDAVFPRPCAAVRIGESKEWLYLRGQLGGGTWAIERVPSHANDNATYRDLRLVIGLEDRDSAVVWSSIELGYVFARQLSYRSSPTDYDFGDAVMLSFTNSY